ncbi:MAG: hypothetical protein A2Z15_00065 [Chloroflexi bacterium RBG_16_50_11]|nr:MAG: hypothetical protein A2Z15_00065 [Chloroflexi bacterium RBG_16_50_11]
MKKHFILLSTIVVILSLIVPVSIAAASPEESQMGLWHLDEGSGLIAYDSSGNYHDGTINGAIWTAGKFGTALSFDGVNDYVQFPPSNLILNNSNFTVHTFFKTSYNHPVYGSGEGRMVNLHRLNPDNSSTSIVALYVERDKIGVLYYNGTKHVWLTYDVAYYDGNWHSIAVTRDNSTYRLYYDGVLVKSQDDTFGTVGTLNAYLGTYNATERFYNGALDEVGIWSRALSSEEIAVLINPVTQMAKFEVKNAYINFYDEEQEDKINVKGVLKLGNGSGVSILDSVKVTIGTLTETITMTEKGKNDKTWVYNRPNNGTGNIKHMTINWKNGEFQVRLDKANLNGMTNPNAVTIGITVGDDVGETTIDMRERKQWKYQASGNN